MSNFLPKYISNKAIWLYTGALFTCNILFFNRMLAPLWWVFGLVEVIGFFYFTNQMTRRWQKFSTKRYHKKLFQTALVIRICWVVFSYLFYQSMTGQPFEFDAADAIGYHGEAQWVVDMLHKGSLKPYWAYINGGYSDLGYPFYLGLQYYITDCSIIIARLLKALYGAFVCVLIYRLSKRSFGEEVGRMAGIFCMLMPNLILYAGIHTKEVEMLMLTVAFVERSDALLRGNRYHFWDIAIPLLLAGSLFFFRTVLGATALFALFTALIFTSDKLMAKGKKIWVGVWVAVTVAYFAGGTIATEVEQVWKSRSKNQQTSMEWRSTREGGNKFAKYASGAVFAPMIFVIPFPTVVETPKQENQKIINGGNYVKNIMAFFALYAFFCIVKDGKWREYVLLGAFTIGYLLVIALSAFAHSERFHQPALPFELVFAAYGVSLMTKKVKKYFTWYLVFIFVAIVGWSWFKLAGRGLV